MSDQSYEARIEVVGEAIRAECRAIFGTDWSNDVAWRLARAADAATLKAIEVPTKEMREAGDDTWVDMPIGNGTTVKVRGISHTRGRWHVIWSAIPRAPKETE